MWKYIYYTRRTYSHSPAHYAEMYRRDGLGGGHVIKLGNGNDAAALAAIKVWTLILPYMGKIIALYG